jgi:hypothetical protein
VYLQCLNSYITLRYTKRSLETTTCDVNSPNLEAHGLAMLSAFCLRNPYSHDQNLKGYKMRLAISPDSLQYPFLPSQDSILHHLDPLPHTLGQLLCLDHSHANRIAPQEHGTVLSISKIIKLFLIL